ncbi:TetR/AcrR family transcriptional regulator [Paenibacillus ihuae]|uniref:TetR/AcrR family transcriptional regulator n=1 Tax=Paenibacillus ihuae TaxID=1232431 RepID=UPI0006D54DA8|nr:TetR/AcrR family transcriptional regulator [Paenibacillus ihuae]
MADKNATKKEQIIKTAMQLFAVKGSSSTSMQEIAELCGISKGSLYLVFKSKEELERSIYIYCFRMIRDPLQREEQQSRSTPKEKLRNQVEILLTHVYELREFLQRQFQEIAGKGGTEVPEWIRKSNAPLLLWFQNKLEILYGREILPYTGDLFLFADGMIHAFIRLIFNQESPVAIARLADHLVDLLDIVAAGLLTGRKEPLISPAILENWMNVQEDSQRRNPLQLIKEMKALLTSVPAAEQQSVEDGLESLAVLESEFLMPNPRKVIIRGMLANLQEHPVLHEELAALQKLISPYMPNSCGFH